MGSTAFNNLLVIGILLSLAIIIYCKIRNETLLELWKEISEIISPTEYE
jgi:hypothetical protein